MLITVGEEGLEEQIYPGEHEGWWSAILTDENERLTALTGETTTEDDLFVGQVDWDKALGIFDRDEILPMFVNGYNRGGLLIEGQRMQGFVPASHLIKKIPDNAKRSEYKSALADYVGRTIEVKIIECVPDQERLIFSERAALAGEGKRKQLINTMQVGDILTGTVTNITDFGAFIDLGGIEGLVHVSELSWGRVQHPNQSLKVGQTVKTLVIQISSENARVALSIKRLTPNPWEHISHHYQSGDVIQATITDIMRYGAFARLDEGIEGLIHISSIRFPPGRRDIARLIKVGQSVRVKILHIDSDKRRLGLGLEETT